MSDRNRPGLFRWRARRYSRNDPDPQRGQAEDLVSPPPRWPNRHRDLLGEDLPLCPQGSFGAGMNDMPGPNLTSRPVTLLKLPAQFISDTWK